MNDTRMLELLLGHLTDAVFFKDAQGRYLRINGVLATWMGLSDPAQAIGKTDADFYPKEFARALSESERALVSSGQPLIDQEEQLVGRDGKSRSVSTTKIPLRDSEGKNLGLLGISRDIKGVKRAEQKTKDSDALYLSLIESLPQCIFRKNLEGRYEYVNQKLCDLAGLRREDFIGKTDFDTNPKALAAKYRRDDQWVMTHQKLFEAVEDFKAKRQKIRIRVTKTPVYDSRGAVVGVQGVFSPLPPSSPPKTRVGSKKK